MLAAAPGGGRRAPRLADAQLAVARELGARSWPALVRDAQARAMARDERARTLVEWATSGRRDDAEALLALDPGLGARALDAALVLGDAERVARAGRDPAARRVSAPALEAAALRAHSAFLGGERTDGLVACASAAGAGAARAAGRTTMSA